MAKGIVSKKTQKKRKRYQDYLSMMKKGGKTAHKKAKTQYEWEKMTPASRKTHTSVARSY